MVIQFAFPNAWKLYPVVSDESFVSFLYINELYRKEGIVFNLFKYVIVQVYIKSKELKTNVPGKLFLSFLSNKIKSSERIELAEEDDSSITNEEEVAMELNNFFSNAVINLKVPKFENSHHFSENIAHPLKAIVKYRKRLSVIAVASELNKEYFPFNTTAIQDELKEISMFKSHRGYRYTSKGNKRQQ